ncbi:MAG TPA: hypothetical protein PKA39_10065, partial [Ignavibacteria bacterium]|nr:hypothetical protein [Ignavibacteria bacterium]
MSCSKCDKKPKAGEGVSFACQCDNFRHPLALSINAGLDWIPRQIAGFPEFRRAMLRTLKGEKVTLINSNNVVETLTPLEGWRARDKDDLGIMLLEMWAYVCDSLSFYDEVLANEAYIKTAFLKPDLRKLVDLLGYIPMPAIGSVVELAALADGRIPVTLPKGTAFRSGAFNGNPPQVFETEDAITIHPFTNSFGIAEPHKGIIDTDFPESLIIIPRGEIEEDAILLLINKQDDLQNCGIRVRKTEQFNGKNNVLFTKIVFHNASLLKSGSPLRSLQLLRPSLSARLWTTNRIPDSVSANKIILNILSYQIHPGDYIMMVMGSDRRWLKINEVEETTRSIVSDPKMIINGNEFEMPGVAVPLTKLTLDTNVNAAARITAGHEE